MGATASRALSGQRTVVSLISAGHCYSHLTSVAVAPLFPALREAFDVSYVALGALMTVFSVATSVAQIPVGLLVDRYGGRLILVIGLVLLGGSFALAGGVDAYWQVVLLMALAGLGNSVFHPADLSILSRRVDPAFLGAHRQPAQLRRLCRLGHRADVDSRAQRGVRLARRVDRGRHRRARDRGGDPVAADPPSTKSPMRRVPTGLREGNASTSGPG